jgi:hypothetical protein
MARPYSTLAVKQKNFNKNIEKDPVTQCWNWTRSVNNVGYGLVRIDSRMMLVHRVQAIWQGWNIDDLVVMHTCDNTVCVNPDHLQVGTMRDNMQDMINKGRQVKGMLGVKHAILTCKHCGISRPKNMIAKYHDDRCPNKPQE